MINPEEHAASTAEQTLRRRLINETETVVANLIENCILAKAYQISMRELNESASASSRLKTIHKALDTIAHTARVLKDNDDLTDDQFNLLSGAVIVCAMISNESELSEEGKYSLKLCGKLMVEAITETLLEQKLTDLLKSMSD